MFIELKLFYTVDKNTITRNSKMKNKRGNCRKQLQSRQQDPREFGYIYCFGIHDAVNVYIKKRKIKI